MSKLNELINKLCPEGVEFKPLGEVCDFRRGQTITERDSVPGDYPVIAGGQKPAYYHNTFNRSGETIAVAGSGAYAGFVSWWTTPIFLSDAFSVHTKDKLLLPKFVYYFMINIQQRIYSTKKGSGVPHVHGSSIAKFLIPLPPLPVQEEIVRILDKFTAYSAELQAELQARKEQYEYYRNLLLNFNHSATGAVTDDEQIDSVTSALPGTYKVKWKTMGEVFEMRNGYTPSKNNAAFWEGGTIPWFRMDDIRQSGRILSESLQHITPAAIKGKGLFEKNSFILATTATIGEHALLIADSLANQQFTNLKICKSLSNKLLTKFIYYYMFIVDEFCKNNTNVSGFASVDMEKLKRMPFPIPPLSIQEKIVSILDRFESLVNDLSEGLPAEIEAEKERYEYFRNKLLSFKPLTV